MGMFLAGGAKRKEGSKGSEEFLGENMPNFKQKNRAKMVVVGRFSVAYRTGFRWWLILVDMWLLFRGRFSTKHVWM